jgi:hypothetical protein
MAILISPYQVSTHCPSCQIREYKTVYPETKVAFLNDRICSGCGARYTPPTPAWAALIFISFGLLVGAGIVFVLLVANVGFLRRGWWFSAGVVPCVLFVAFGVRSLLRKGQ